MLRFTFGFFLATTALASLGFAHAQTDPAADSLRLYAVADLLGIGANTVETQQHHQGQKTWISRIYVTSLCRH
jgi:hypothetical protein